MRDSRGQTPAEHWFRLSVVAGGVCALVVTIIAAVRTHNHSASDFLCFHETAKHFLKTRTITDEFGVFGNPPFFTVLMTPFSIELEGLGAALSVDPAVFASLLWSAVNIAMLCAAIVLVDRVMVPGRIQNPLIRVTLPAALAAPYLIDSLALGQLGVLVLFLLVMMWVLYDQKQEWWAGVILSLAIQVKVFPVFWLGYWLLKQRWRVLGGALIGLAGTTLLAMQSLTFKEGTKAHDQWMERSARVSGEAFGDGPSEFFRFRNEGLPFTLRRLFSNVNAGGSADPFHVNIADLSGSAVYTIFAVSVVLLAAWLGISMRRPSQECSPTRLRYEAAVMMIAPLWFSPIVWVHYLPLAYPALATLSVQFAHDNLRGHGRRWVSAAAVLLWIGAALMLASEYMRALGVHLWSSLALAAVLLYLARRSD
jgi:hypothetical protein